MASFSGTTSGSSQEDLQQLMDIRKRKRMISNRESARRSRMRKQKISDDLTTQLNQLKEQKIQIATNINMVTHLFLNVEAENSILRAQMDELNQRLQSLNEIINFAYPCRSLEKCTATFFDFEESDTHPMAITFSQTPSNNIAINYHHELDDFLNYPWNLVNVHHQQPIMASSDHSFMY
ncbi:hypothetical protein HAX54_016242 [Datura stramonium]|uniref:BZIP domain-containing protein n=1 Tax=Datura stramonium TaxID=4076 RepID=A0ABS8UKH5_DATST|nr:hypothetical protein [Datura stramonium]